MINFVKVFKALKVARIEFTAKQLAQVLGGRWKEIPRRR